MFCVCVCVCVHSTIKGQDGSSVRTNTDLSEYLNGIPGSMEREKFLGQLKNIETWRMPLCVKFFEMLIFIMQHVNFFFGGGGFCVSSVKCFLGFPCSKHSDKGSLWRLFHLQTQLWSHFKHFFQYPNQMHIFTLKVQLVGIITVFNAKEWAEWKTLKCVIHLFSSKRLQVHTVHIICT